MVSYSDFIIFNFYECKQLKINILYDVDILIVIHEILLSSMLYWKIGSHIVASKFWSYTMKYSKRL